MSNITPCLWFATNCEEAVKFYVSVFRNSKILRTSYYGQEGYLEKGTVLVIEFEIEGQKMMALNGGKEPEYNDSLSLHVGCQTQEILDEYWDKLTANGGKEVQCGWLKDRFGVSWQIVPTFLDGLFADPDSAKADRVMKAMMGMVKLDIAKLQEAALPATV